MVMKTCEHKHVKFLGHGDATGESAIVYINHIHRGKTKTHTHTHTCIVSNEEVAYCIIKVYSAHSDNN